MGSQWDQHSAGSVVVVRRRSTDVRTDFDRSCSLKGLLVVDFAGSFRECSRSCYQTGHRMLAAGSDCCCPGCRTEKSHQLVDYWYCCPDYRTNHHYHYWLHPLSDRRDHQTYPVAGCCRRDHPDLADFAGGCQGQKTVTRPYCSCYWSLDFQISLHRSQM